MVEGFEDEGPWGADSWRFKQAFGPFVATRHTEAFATTVVWWREREA